MRGVGGTLVSCIRPLVLVRKTRRGLYQHTRLLTLVPVYKTVNTGIGSKIIGADTGAYI